MIVINFKNYVHGKKAIRLAKLIEKYIPNAIVCPSAYELDEIANLKKLNVYAQHIDYISGKRATGWIVPKVVKKIGAKGTLLNHSEHRLPFRILKESVKEAKKAGLKVIVCIPSLSYVRAVKKLKPYAIAFEDAKLIGSGKSITSYRSREVKKFAKKLKGSGIKALCGAGINSIEDIKSARNLDCNGVLIASAIAKDLKKGEKLLKELRKI